MSKLDLIGEHVGGFVVQTIRVAIDDLEIAGIELLAFELCEERLRGDFEEDRSVLELSAATIDALDHLVGECDGCLDLHTTKVRSTTRPGQVMAPAIASDNGYYDYFWLGDEASNVQWRSNVTRSR